jgi:2,3-bisphosphoglycerate-dependent phosphoglycerate mutase
MRPIRLVVRALSIALAVGFGLTAAGELRAQSNPGVTTVVLVRHAEKTENSYDPPLSAAGERRVQALVRILSDVPIDAIYSTPFARTRDTARPLARARGLPVLEDPVPSSSAYAAEMADRVLTQHRGDVILFVGHSNTTVDLIAALGVTDPPTIAEEQYDHLFIVTILPDGGARLLTLRYGQVTP